MSIVGLSGMSLGVSLGHAIGGVELPFSIGYLSNRHEGTVGDFYVATDGSDAADGTLLAPFATMTKAISVAAAGNTIRVRGGTYLEAVDASLFNGTLARYGTEEVIISGGNVAAGWAPCVAGDAAIVGANWAQLYKVTIPTANIASSNPRAAFLMEAGAPLNPAMGWLPNPRYPLRMFATSQYLTATETVTSLGKITGHRLPALTDLYTQSQIERCDVVFHRYANSNSRTPVASFDTITKTINLTDQTLAYESNAYKDRFALINLIPAISQGGWGYSVSGADTTFYIWPRNVANLTGGITYAARGYGVKITSNAELRGLIFEHHASAGSVTDGLYPISAGGVTKKQNAKVKNCKVRNFWRMEQGYGGLWFGNIDDYVIEDLTIENAYGAFGMFCQGQSTDSAKRGRVRRVLVAGSELSPVRMFGQEGCWVSRAWATRDCGIAAHANKSNFYAQSHRVAYHCCNFAGASGYLTWQETSAIALLCNYVPASYLGTDGRAVVDQNNAIDTPAVTNGQSGASFVLCNALPPYAGAAANTNALSLGTLDSPEVTYTAKANVAHGASATRSDHMTAAGYNILTSGTALDASDITTTSAAMYEDAASGNLAYRIGAPIHTAPRPDLSAEIATIKSWFPDVPASEFDRDLLGDAITWAAAPIGPVGDYTKTLGFDPVWVDSPVINGTAIVGGALTVSSGYLAASPFPATTRQWKRSLDAVTWADIAGQTGASYTVAAGDIGYYIGCAVTAGGDEAFAYNATAAVSSYPLGDPTLATAVYVNNANGTQRETAEFTVQNRPMVVIVQQDLASGADAAQTVTIGAAGRAFGTGTAIPQTGLHRRTNQQITAHFVAAPGVGAVTIQVESAASGCVRIIPLYIDGATSVTAGTNTQATAITLTKTQLATANNGIFIYAGNKAVSNTFALSATGAAQLDEGALSDSRTLVAWEQSSVSGASYDATVQQTGGSAGGFVLAAFEVRS